VVITAKSRPLLLGHRGMRPQRRLRRRNHELPPGENTLAAFDYALKQGCDGFEFDVRHTRDGRNILCHDPNLLGMTLAETESAELADSERIAQPYLESVLEHYARRAYLDIELKTGGNEEQVVAALRKWPPACGYVVSSFLPEVLMHLAELDSTIPLAYICNRASEVEHWKGLPITVFLPNHRLVSRRLIEEVHRRDVRLMTWTVNSQREMLRLAEWGVDGLISDDPTSLRLVFPTPPKSKAAAV
jgi:glycerophosphoryl diester phosphodiesterase